ncbi:hypothetical protein M3Y97_00821500 [Aphelenchoides bicaudatus]|nr:hypothetical protein M3Y97_00821500 [Aphelenchoides bicaudatus]
MDPFGASPAQPGSVINSIFGGQTPASNVNILHNSNLNGPNSAFNPQSIHGIGNSNLNMFAPGSLTNPGSVFSGIPASFMQIGGPGSVLNNQINSIGNGPGSIFNSNNGPGSITNVYIDREPPSVINLNGIPGANYNPGSVTNNLAVPMTPLAGADIPSAREMPASNIPALMPATPMSTAIIDVPSPTLQNIVSTVNLGVQLDLKKIALHARNAEYNPKRFAAVIMRIREPRTTALIFSSGKMVCTGAKSEQASRLAARKYARIIQKLGFDAKFTEFKVQNMVGSCDVKFPIQLEGLCLMHAQFSTYEPELFPGLIYRMVKPRVVLLIFVSGKVVITGAKFKKDIDQAFNQIYPILKCFKK